MDTEPFNDITFLFTDIEGNTGLWNKFPEKMAAVLMRHDELIETLVAKQGGDVVRPRGEGDSRFIVFKNPQNAVHAVLAAAEIQQALHDEPWPIPTPLRVRIALHTGDAAQIDQDYYGADVNRCAGLRTLTYGGQTLLSAKTAQLARTSLPPTLQLRDLHYHYLKGDAQPEQVFQLVVAGMPNEFLPLKKQPLPSSVKKQQSAEQRKRQALIENVQHDWIDGVLNRSLQQAMMLNLGIKLLPDASKPAAQDQSQLYATQTAMTEIYKRFDNQLLILGAPGSGKTTALLILTSLLLGEAEGNQDAPIPVIFNLSSWASKRPRLEVWLVEELERQLRVPKAIGRAWVQKQQIIPLLDGLDEVTSAQRDACVLAINEYQKTHQPKALVVCCRSGEYAALAAQLTLKGAIEVQPLTFSEVEAYFKGLGTRFNDLVARLQQDSTLRELITSPLLVSVVTVVHEDLPKTGAEMSSDAYRAMLFKTYVEHTLTPSGRHQPPAQDEPFREPAAGPYTLPQVQQWLGWLAAWLNERNETTFYIEHLQPDVLSFAARRWYTRLLALILALLIGVSVGFGVNNVNTGIVWAVSAWLMIMLMGDLTTDRPWIRPLRNSFLLGSALGVAESLQDSLLQLPTASLIVIMIAAIIRVLLFGTPTFIASLVYVRFAHDLYQFIRKIDKLIALPVTVMLWIAFSFGIGIVPFYLAGIYLTPESYKFSDLYQRSFGVASSTLICGSLFVTIGQEIRLVERLQWSWRPSLLFSFLAVAAYKWNQPKTAIISASIITLSGLTGITTVETRRSPNQGIWQSVHYSILGAGVGIVLWCCLWLMLPQYAQIGMLPVLAIVVALRSGLLPSLQHLLIRLFLWWDGVVVFNFVHFLEAMVSSSLLYRTGGGYIFIHRLLLEHFLPWPEK